MLNVNTQVLYSAVAYFYLFIQGRKLRHFTKVHECLKVSSALIVFVSAVTSVLILFDNLKNDFFSQRLELKIKATLVRNVY